MEGAFDLSVADLGSSNSGFYDLQAVLTHQGRTNNSGHYVGWVRRSGQSVALRHIFNFRNERGFFLLFLQRTSG